MRTLVVTVDAVDAELAADRLWQLGVRAVEERAGAGGCVELWTAVGDDVEATDAAASTFEPGWRWRTEPISTEWPQTWRDHAAAMPVGERLVVVPAWRAHEARTPHGDRVALLIEPGAAFGLGDHPTTSLTLAALDREMAEADAPAVLDVGCGTGVLAIAAAKLGAARVRAVDISATAVETTVANAARNDVGHMIEVDTSPIGELAGRYDLVVANILAPALIAMADDLVRLTAPSGRLVVSGVLSGNHDHVLGALGSMRVCRSDRAAGWAAVTLAHA